MSVKTMKKTIILLFIMGTVIFVSGCTNSTVNYDPDAGGVIQSLSFDFGAIDDDEDVSLEVEIQNVGGKTIDSTDLYIYGPVLGTNDAVWKVDSVIPSVSFQTPYIHDNIPFADFLPPDPDLEIPGGGIIYDVLLLPPNIPDGMKITEQFYARLCFPYSTSTLTQLEITTKNELRATGVTKTKAQTINAAGPIHLEMKGQKTMRSKDKELPLVFSVIDVGGGFATRRGDCIVDTETRDRNWVTATVIVDGDTNVDCGDGTNTADVRIRDGIGTLFCKYNFGETGAPRTTFKIDATAEYNYYVEKSATIQLKDSPVD